MPKQRYLQQTAKAFGTAGKLPRHKSKVSQKSGFVRFFEKMEKDDPIWSPFSKYEQWTRAVRQEMTDAGRWPTGLQECRLLIVAEYISRLLHHFWQVNHSFDRSTFDLYRQFKDLNYSSSLEAICEKIRRRGIRDGTYVVPWYTDFLDKERSYLYTWESGGVIREWAIYIEPWHSECLVAKMIASGVTSIKTST